MNAMSLRIVLFGVAFGFVLSRVGATDYDAISGMFRFTDLQLAGVIGLAIFASALAFTVIKKRKLRTPSGTPITLVPKPMVRGLVLGALLFGVGWALSGTCPGTAIAQIGEGRRFGLVTFAGMILGTYLASAPFPARSESSLPT